MRASWLPEWARGLPWLPLLVLAAVGLCAAIGEDMFPFDPNQLDLSAAFGKACRAARAFKGNGIGIWRVEIQHGELTAESGFNRPHGGGQGDTKLVIRGLFDCLAASDTGLENFWIVQASPDIVLEKGDQLVSAYFHGLLLRDWIAVLKLLNLRLNYFCRCVRCPLLKLNALSIEIFSFANMWRLSDNFTNNSKIGCSLGQLALGCLATSNKKGIDT